MKKAFTLALTLFILGSAFSQSYSGQFSYNSPSVDVQFNHHYDPYSFERGDKFFIIKKINFEYDQKINDVMGSWINPRRKARIIERLQNERNDKIQEINNRFYNDYGNHYNDQYRNNGYDQGHRDDNWNR